MPYYYIPIKFMNDTSLEMSVFWPSDTESWINELRFSDFVSLSFKMRLTVTLCKMNFKHGTRDGKHDGVTQEMKLKGKSSRMFFWIKDQNRNQKKVRKKVYNKHIIITVT